MLKKRKIYRDARGEIRFYDIKGVAFNALYTNKGFLRSGDYHPFAQYDLIIKGKMVVTVRKGNKDIRKSYGPKELIVIPAKVPHLFKAEADTLMIEWWDGPYAASYYAPYRRLVEEKLRKK